MSQTCASVEITCGSQPSGGLSFAWYRVENNSVVTVVADQTSSELRFEQTERTHDGSYYVEISCSTLRGRMTRSRMMKLRVIQSVLAEVQDIMRKKGKALTDDTPRAVIVDSAGQRMYYMMLRLLLTEALTIYILAVSLEYDLDAALECAEDVPYNMTHGDNLHFWLNTIHGQAPTAPVLIVCTKADLVSEEIRAKRIQTVQDCVESSVAFKCGLRIVAYKVVSSSTGEGIEAVRNVLEKERTLLKHYGSQVSVGWFRFFSIIQELATKEHRISLSAARSIARACGISCDKEFRRLLQKATGIGLLLWHDTTYARNLVVLDMEWMITHMTGLICRRGIQERCRSDECLCDRQLLKQLHDHGRLDPAVLPEIWSALRSDEERVAMLEYLTTFGLLAKLPSSSAAF